MSTEPDQTLPVTPSLHRRDLLKALAASGGALAAAAFLPARWFKPVVEAGVLPAHAQSSVCATLQFVDEFRCGQSNIPCGNYEWIAIFRYDPASYTPQSLASFTACGQSIPSDLYPSPVAGQLYVRYSIPPSIPPGGCRDSVVRVLFAEGCYGVYIQTGAGPTFSSGGLLR
jgi:hypothetical protein